METIALNPDNVQPMDAFYRDAAAGELPAYSWINPRSGMDIATGIGSNDQHPDHDVAAGELFLKEIYEGLRASPNWNETLLVITYDEHGGFWDHVPPPGAPVPDTKASYPDFNYTFDRLGVRIPTVLVSPLIPRGTVVSAPPAAQKPAEDSEYEATSIMATARILLGMSDAEPLTARDAWAATFEHVLSLDAPRADCPMELPDAPAPQSPFDDPAYEASLPPNDLQLDMADMLAKLAGEANPMKLERQDQVSAHLEGLHRRAVARIRSRLADAKGRRSRGDASAYDLVVVPANSAFGAGSRQWVIPGETPAGDYSNITVQSTGLRGFGESTAYCIDAEPKDGAVAGLELCDAAAATRQRWTLTRDGQLKAAAAPDLCLTATMFDSGVVVPSGAYNKTMVVEACDGGVHQHYAWHGSAPGDDGGGIFFYGDGANVIAAMEAK